MRAASAVLAALFFLVLAFGYRLAVAGGPDPLALIAVAAAVGIAGAAGARLADH